ALNACIAATTGLPTSGVSTPRFAGPPIRLSAGVYKVSDAIQVTDTVGIRITGGGFWNTYVSITAGETGTATSGSTTTLVNSGKSWTTNQWGTGRWQAYIYAGTGSGQWGDIQSNTGTTLTFSTALGVAPDSTSQYVIAGKAVLDLDGFFSGTLSDFQVMGGGYFRHGIKYYRHGSLSARGSSQGRFDRVTIGGNYVDSGWQFGSNDVAGDSGFQADLVDISKCQAFGQGATTGIFAGQVGYRFGDNTFANALNFTADGCESVLNAYGVAVSTTNLLWMGGTIQSSALADVLLNQGNQGFVHFVGNRSEGSRMLLDSTSTESVGFTLAIDDWQFQLDQFQGQDLIGISYGPAAVRLSGIRTASPTAITGQATSGSTTTLTNTAASFPTATVTNNGGSSVGLQGWDLQITAGTGVGQRAKITSNTATGLVFPALAIALDNTSQYQIMPRPRINVHSSGGNVEINRCYFTGTPIEDVLQSSSGHVFTWSAVGYGELDVNGNLVTRAIGESVHGSL